MIQKGLPRGPQPPKSRAVPSTPRVLIIPTIASQADDNESPAAKPDFHPELASEIMTAGELLSRAKLLIDSSETSLRAAAEDIARAYEQNVTQRDIAEGVGRSPAWVNRLLKWRSSGYEGKAFGGNSVQGVNKKSLTSAPSDGRLDSSTKAGFSQEAPLVASVQGNGDSLNLSEVTSDATLPAAADRSRQSFEVRARNEHDSNGGATVDILCDYHLPTGCNRQDPEAAFQRLTHNWSSSPFRHLLLDAPKAAKHRFLRDVLLPEVDCIEPVGPVCDSNVDSSPLRSSEVAS